MTSQDRPGFWTRQRAWLSNGWVVIAASIVYLISQIVIGTILEQIGGEKVMALQVGGTTAEIYKETFAAWQAQGLMDYYHAHFIFDDVHWIWYALSLASLLSFMLNRAGKGPGLSWLIALPIVAGLCDLLENSIQHVFLVAADYSTIIDPLPLISTAASITKWSFAALTLILILSLFVSSRLGKGRSASNA